MIGVHLIDTPSGNWTFVGSVPYSLCEIRRATRSDVMGGRAFEKGGLLWAPYVRSFKTREEALAFAEKQGVTDVKEPVKCRSSR